MIGNRSLFSLLFFVFSLIICKGQQKTDSDVPSSNWGLGVSLESNLSFVDDYYVKDGSASGNLGGRLSVLHKIWRDFSFSYSVFLSRNSYTKSNFIDARSAVDDNGNFFNDKIRRFNVTVSHTYLAPSLALNYTPPFHIGKHSFSTSLEFFLKYYIRHRTAYHLYDGVEESLLTFSDITFNYLIFNPSLALSLNYIYELNDRYFLQMSATYRYDFNFLQIQRFHNLGISVGAFINL